MYVRLVRTYQHRLNWLSLIFFQKLNDHVSISYQVTAEGGGGVVSARDFIFIYKNMMKGNTFVQGGCSVDYPGPKSSKIVR